MIEMHLFIDGAIVPSASGRTYTRTNPANGEPVGTFSLANAADAERAVAAARTAFDDGRWSDIDSEERANVMLRTADLLMQRQEELALDEMHTTGSPLRFTRSFIESAASTFRYFAGLARTIHGDAYTFNSGQIGLTLKEPVGVVSLILPWNFPLGEATWKVCPALAAGCTMVVKPDTKTPTTALKLAEILKQAGLPDGVYNVVVGEPADLSDTLTAHPHIDHISFTGSTNSGRIIMGNASPTVKPLHLELGGKSPLIVFEDADLDAAAQDAAFGIFWHCGQVCTASSRLLVQASAADAFLEKLKAQAEGMTIGDPTDENVSIGPLVSEQHLERVLDYVAQGIDEGAELVLGGKRLTDPPFAAGAYLPPTIFSGVQNHMRIAQEEIFGPVAAVIPFADAQDALRIANDSEFGLGAGLWTRNIDTALHMARRLKAGSVWVNGYGAERLEMPWGGYKQSGYGRELGREGLDEYLQTKSVHIRHLS